MKLKTFKVGERFIKDLEELEFVDLQLTNNGEFLVLDNRITRWGRFWNQDWLCQVLKDIITKKYWVCFSECNNFRSLEPEEIIEFNKVLMRNTKK